MAVSADTGTTGTHGHRGMGGSGVDGSVLGMVVLQKSDSESMAPGAICSINDLPDVYTVLKACKHALMASCKSRR